MSKSKKYVYLFGGKKNEGKASMKNLLGGKGANLAEMCSLGVNVPAGFTISTEYCTKYYEDNQKYSAAIKAEVKKAVAHIEKTMGAKFGDKKNPLLVSVRSGARVSMPGMMDTILNLGLNDVTVQGIIDKTGNERFAYDSYRRFLQMYGDVVMGMKPESKLEEDPFEIIIEKIKHKKGVALDTELETKDLIEMVKQFKAIIKKRTGKNFPQKAEDQLWGAVSAVFQSWNNERAVVYRKMNNIDAAWGTAVNVQAMVYGNMGDDCGTGVAFTRDPSTGEKVFYGEYLINAQGEDVVAGTRTPQQVTLIGSKKWAKENGIKESDRKNNYPSLEEAMPSAYKDLVRIYKKLEKHYKDMQDIEFTIQQGKLWMLQTRNGKRTAAAALKIAVDMVKEKMITQDMAVMRVEPAQLDQLLHPTFDPKAKKTVIAKGLPASPGAATGRICFHADDAVEVAEKGEPVILVRVETSPEDISGMNVAKGILTARGGMTSHAAVVARGMGTCCVAGCEQISISYKKASFTVGGKTYKEGDFISLNGSTGEVMSGKVDTMQPKLSQDFKTLMSWADARRALKIRTNADTPADSEIAIGFGAEGIGLCRTEHMFFEGDRIKAVREMILSDDLAGREKALKKLLPMQRKDFYGIFKAMGTRPVTIRLLDPPLHEFVPHEEKSQKEMAKEMGIKPADVKAKVESLEEFNPMLGHRGCRLGIIYPEITKMQATAIFEATARLAKEKKKVIPEVMVPLIGTSAEFKLQKEIIDNVAKDVMKAKKVKFNYLVGTMIEIPRAALTADKVAETAEFFSFGTNDLTQMTFGYSRDDAGKFLPEYVDRNILVDDPFQALDQEGVGQLVEIGIERGRKTKPDLKIGICGEHGGEPSSVDFCHRVGMDYVSCSPYRVPLARLAAAQANMANPRKTKKATKKKTVKKAAKKKK